MSDQQPTPRLLPALKPWMLSPRAVADGGSLMASRAVLALLLLELDEGLVRLLQVLAESARPDAAALARLQELGLVDGREVTPLGSELLGAMGVPA